jgi:hypothetical protein
MKKSLSYFLLAVLMALILFMSSCGILKDRKVNKSTERIRFVDNSLITTRTPGDVIILPAPRVPNPRDTIIVVKGDKGATVTSSYGPKGELQGQVFNCPDSEETKQLDIKGEYDIKTKQIEKKANIEMIREVGKWASIILIPGQLFFALAWWLRSKNPVG